MNKRKLNRTKPAYRQAGLPLPTVDRYRQAGGMLNKKNEVRMPSIKISGWILVLAIVVIIAAWLLGFISLQVCETALGVIGVTGFTGLRLLINSSGFKTYIFIAIGVVGIVLFALQKIDQGTYTILMSLVFGTQSTTIGSAINKTPDDLPALKKAA